LNSWSDEDIITRSNFESEQKTCYPPLIVTDLSMHSRTFLVTFSHSLLARADEAIE